jgi:ABC-type transport system substrate-binding protein
MPLRTLLGGAALALVALVLGAGAGGGTGSTDARNGGIFRVALWSPDFDSLDPALSYSAGGWAVLDLTCVHLMAYPDKPPPDGFRLTPQVATAFPKVSADGRTYTFTLRRSFRFSNGAPVLASAFARAINRTLAPAMRSPGAQYTQDIVGAEAVQAGRTTAAAGVVASGYRLVVRLKRAAPDFPARTSMPFFCAVPPTLPADPEGAGAFPVAGPYAVTAYSPGRRIVLRRNRHYGGRRPHHVDGFDFDLQATSQDEVLSRVQSGRADWGWAPPPFYFDPAKRFAARYGVNKARFWVKPGLARRSFVLNTSRPLFRNNPKLRQALNFAVDRRGVVRAGGSLLAARLTDQYLPHTLPGFRDAAIYPPRPNLTRARALARGRTRSGKAVLYTFDAPLPLALAQIVKRNLARIGLAVTVRGIPPPAYFGRVARRGEPFDIAFLPWAADYIDPYSYINLQFESRFSDTTNAARFASPGYDRAMRHAARLRGQARYAAYGALDVRLAREQAPVVSIAFDNEATLVSARVGCIVLRPNLILAAACLR